MIILDEILKLEDELNNSKGEFVKRDSLRTAVRLAREALHNYNMTIANSEDDMKDAKSYRSLMSRLRTFQEGVRWEKSTTEQFN